LAIALQFVNVIVRRSAIERQYPGGLDGFARQDLANHLEDEYLVRVGFMSTRDADGFVNELEAAGLRCSNQGESDVAIWHGFGGAPPPWLTVGECEGREACWLSDGPPGKLVDLDPLMLLRLPAAAFPSLADVVRVLREEGAEVRERSVLLEGKAATILDCARGDARIEVEVIQDTDSGRPAGLWGRRDLSRRTSIEVDQMLMRDLTSALVRGGAQDH
jgi:hypothetical protein